ncbi:MAG: rane-anchored band 7 domain protein [Haloplasmataceae bacterium]|jgi:regulator of protease activity HflC (stomatin/prohibitin superfamily)|nr:rane-anchored band 7 domain protein [Haloplasmataceae bacterium]
MAILIIGVVASFVSLIVLIGTRKAKRGNFNIIEVVVPVLVFAVFLGVSSIKSIGAAEVGVLYSPLNGGIQENTLGSGWHFTNPLNTVYKISTTQKHIQFDTFSVQTEDSEYADFIVEMTYRIPQENAYKIYQRFEGMPENDDLQLYVQTAIKGQSETFNIYDILGSGYEELRLQSFNTLQTTLLEFGVELIELNFIDIDAGEQIEQAIVNKGIIKQQKEQAEQEKFVAAIVQETKIIEAATAKLEQVAKAEADAEQKLIAAEAEAERIRLEAQAQSEAIRLIIDQLQGNPDYIEYIKWSNWDGKLPEVMAGESANIIVDSTNPVN